MALPTCNPIDYGWFSQGAALDHEGTIKNFCKVCDLDKNHEKFIILVGSSVGFGAPFFAKPFIKHSSTKGKLGGTKGRVIQCTGCNSLYAFDQDGVQALAKAGLPAELIALERANEFRNREAKKIEDEGDDGQQSRHPFSPSKRIPKTRE